MTGVSVLGSWGPWLPWGTLFFLSLGIFSSWPFWGPQALHGLAPKCKLINMHELINKSTNDYVILLPCENGANVNNKG